MNLNLNQFGTDKMSGYEKPKLEIKIIKNY